MTQPKFTRTTLDSTTGARLAVYQCAPVDTETRGIVHINHGLAEHAQRYRDFAAYLAGRGYAVISQDHRGHGETTAPDGGPRRFADHMGWNKVMGDVASVNAFARKTHPGLPLIVFGHSMGGVIAMNQVLRAPGSVDAAAIWNSNLALGPLAAVMRLILFFEGLGGAGKPSQTLDKLSFKAWAKRFPEQRTEFDWLSRDPAAVDAYVADERCGWPASISLWRDLIRGTVYCENRSNYRGVRRDLPFHLIGGSADPVTNYGQAVRALEKRLRALKFSDVTCAVLEDFRHETINEIGAGPEMRRFADWLDRVTGGDR